MKKIFSFLIIVFVFYSMVNAQTGTQRPAFNRGVRTIQSWGQDITFHKRTSNGNDTLYTRGETDGWIRGALDSLFTDCYFNYGKNNVQFNVDADTGVADNFAIEIKVLTVNPGDTDILSVPDSLFETYCWLKKGTGVGYNIISTTQDSITTVGQTGTIDLYLGSSGWYKFLFIGTSMMTDTNRVEGFLNRQER